MTTSERLFVGGEGSFARQQGLGWMVGGEKQARKATSNPICISVVCAKCLFGNGKSLLKKRPRACQVAFSVKHQCKVVKRDSSVWMLGGAVAICVGI
jgi:hypothetical protein